MHFVSESCRGVRCHMCKQADATHKVGEEVPHDAQEYKPFDQQVPAYDPYLSANYRHNLTAYVCCECFGKIMGRVARDWCGLAEGTDTP